MEVSASLVQLSNLESYEQCARVARPQAPQMSAILECIYPIYKASALVHALMDSCIDVRGSCTAHWSFLTVPIIIIQSIQGKDLCVSVQSLSHLHQI